MATEGAVRITQGPNQTDLGVQLGADQILVGTGIGDAPVATDINDFFNAGTYTPTLTNVSNMTDLTPSVCQWLRIGNVVTVSGVIVGSVTTTDVLTSFRMSLPVSSNFSAETQCGGSAVALGIAPEAYGIAGEITANLAQAAWNSVTTGVINMSFSFTYLVV